MSKQTVIRVSFDDDLEAARFLQSCRRKGLNAQLEDFRPIGDVKRNGPDLAAWLRAKRGWQVVLASANRRSAWNAAWKISHGTRRGFEDLMFEARTVNRNGEWVVEARWKGHPTAKGKDRDKPESSMEPLF
ncbi:hypothetical protein KIH79_12375 [Bifidobacterium sp. 82T10]|uniref:Uncharacterized protein n=1 Tax=Bifidobacterium miconis TaxID=2834435 RepID=A0ABS6WI31_9BIFI|nr:hypothetical protein [Bifidobacterium miconis]MBW3093695.1 hypothetical protein [Bifidobacterium miconis]